MLTNLLWGLQDCVSDETCPRSSNSHTSANEKRIRCLTPISPPLSGPLPTFLRGDYKQSEYGKVILLFTVLRRLDCVLESTKPAVLDELAKRVEISDDERLVMGHQLDRLDRWTHELANKIGYELSA